MIRKGLIAALGIAGLAILGTAATSTPAAAYDCGPWNNWCRPVCGWWNAWCGSYYRPSYSFGYWGYGPRYGYWKGHRHHYHHHHWKGHKDNWKGGHGKHARKDGYWR